MTTKIKISIVIITYNQEKIVQRSIESVISQRDYLYELIICDDCSTDKTWNVLEKYKTQFPDKIKIYRNEKNLGIFGNMENSWSKITGNLVSYLAGDDEIRNGYLEAVTRFATVNKIDCNVDYSSILSDYVVRLKSGKDILRKNNAVANTGKYCSLKIRNIVSNFAAFSTISVVRKYYPVRKDIGLFADGLIDIQLELFSQKCYYLPFIGAVHYDDIGITSRVSYDLQFKSYVKYLDLVLEVINATTSDKKYVDYKKVSLLFSSKPTFANLVKCCFLYIASRDLSLGVLNMFTFDDLRLLKNKVVLLIKSYIR